MGLGVLGAFNSEHVPGISPYHSSWIKRADRSPGTSFVFDDESRQIEVNSTLKYDTSGPVPIILVPQPSDDPNDPLVIFDFFAIVSVS